MPTPGNIHGNCKFTDEVAETIYRWLKRGCFLGTACRAAGINETTFRNWIGRGKHGEEPFATFLNKCEAIMSEVECKAAEAALEQDPKWWLSRGYAKRRWRELKAEPVEGEQDKPTKIEVELMPVQRPMNLVEEEEEVKKLAAPELEEYGLDGNEETSQEEETTS